MKRKLCCNCVRHIIPEDPARGGTPCKYGNYQDQSINLKYHDYNWAERCMGYKEKVDE
jgi:hypothetical protein